MKWVNVRVCLRKKVNFNSLIIPIKKVFKKNLKPYCSSTEHPQSYFKGCCVKFKRCYDN